MRTNILTPGIAAGVLTVSALVSGCSSGGGTLGDILGGVLTPGPQGGQVVAEVQAVDTREGEIDVRTEAGETGSIGYDSRTVVVYQGRQFDVTALERGDLVVMEVQETEAGGLYTNRIEVTQSVQDRTGEEGGSGLEGTVEWVDRDGGRFGLRRRGGSTVTVSLAWDASRATLDRFNALRQGDYVRIEGSWLNDERVELIRFR